MTPEETKKRIEDLEKSLKDLSAEYHTNNFTASQDFNKYSRFNTRLRVPHLSATPTSCETGELCEVSGKLYVCSAADTWVVAGTQS